jgi:ketosteroid isomerase-like protein
MVMLAPKLAVKPGRDAIQKHYESIFAAGATNITLEVQQVEARGSDAAWAAGSYAVIVKDKTIEGNWFRVLKREGGAWKIAMEGFARAGAIDAPVTSASSK